MPEHVDNPIPDRTSATRESILQMSVVPPGHPCLIAMQIMEEYEAYASAIDRDDSGLLAVMGNSNIRGTGGNVQQTIHFLGDLMQRIHSHIGKDLASLIATKDLTLVDLEPTMQFEIRGICARIHDEECGKWKIAREIDKSSDPEKGNRQAERFFPMFVDMASKWTIASMPAYHLSK